MPATTLITRATPIAMAAHTPPTERYPNRSAVVLLTMVWIALWVIGYSYHQEQVRATEKAAHQQIRVIGDLKAQEIAWWLKERQGDAVTLHERPISPALLATLADPNNSDIRQSVHKWLRSLAHYYDYSDVMLLDRDARILLSAPQDRKRLEDRTRTFVAESLRLRKVVFTDIYGNPEPHLDFIVPLMAEDMPPLGFLLLRVDPDRFLFPLLKNWPTPSASGETLLVHREGDEVVFLHPLRHRPQMTSTLRLPLDNPKLPAARVIQGERGEMIGIDYRGEEVLAAVRAIPGSPWYVVAKMDREEISTPIQQNALRTGIVVILLMLVASLLAWIGWRRQFETTLRGMNQLLERRVEERTTHLQTLNRQLQQEIVERHQAQEAQRQSEMMFRQLVENLHEIFWIASVDGNTIFYVSPAYEEIRGHSCQHLYQNPKDWLEAIHPDDRYRVEDIHALIIENGKIEAEYRIVQPDGSIRWIWSRSFLIQTQESEIRHIAGIMQDITLRKTAEVALAESQQRLQAIFDNALDVILLADDEARLVDANPVACSRLARTRQEILKMTVLDIMPVQDRDQGLRLWKAFVEENGKQAGEYSLVRPDGKILAVEYCAVANILPGLHLSVLRDVTERNETQELIQRQQAELVHMSRLSLAGEMAAGLAHELNQPLTAITTYLETCKEWFNAEQPHVDRVPELLEKAIKQSLRASAIIRNLRTFVSKRRPEYQPVDLNEQVRNVARFMETEARHQETRVRLNLADSLPRVEAEPIQIQQVIMNLVRNSLDALTQVPALDREILIQTLPIQNEMVELRIEDTGPGITKEAKDDLFIPFFTTKEKGMGLGLSICQTIIQAHKGRLWATTGQDNKVTFHFVLPCTIAGSDK